MQGNLIQKDVVVVQQKTIIDVTSSYFFMWFYSKTCECPLTVELSKDICQKSVTRYKFVQQLCIDSTVLHQSS